MGPPWPSSHDFGGVSSHSRSPWSVGHIAHTENNVVINANRGEVTDSCVEIANQMATRRRGYLVDVEFA